MSAAKRLTAISTPPASSIPKYQRVTSERKMLLRLPVTVA